jgi:hypothetical protein
MSHDDVLVGYRRRLFTLAEEIGVRPACLQQPALSPCRLSADADGSVERVHLDKVVDDREVGSVDCEEWEIMDVGGGGDREVDRPPPWAAAALGHGGGQVAPFAGDRCVYGEWIEGRLDHAESLRSSCSFIRIGGDERPEVQFGQRGGADRSFEVAGIG